jgi:hypothetical protein
MKKVSDRIRAFRKKSLEDIKRDIIKDLSPKKDIFKEKPVKKFGSGGYGSKGY